MPTRSNGQHSTPFEALLPSEGLKVMQEVARIPVLHEQVF